MTDVGRARRRHLRRIRMRGREVRTVAKQEIQRGTVAREVERGTVAREVERGTVAKRKKCYGQAVLLTPDNRSARGKGAKKLVQSKNKNIRLSARRLSKVKKKSKAQYRREGPK